MSFDIQYNSGHKIQSRLDALSKYAIFLLFSSILYQAVFCFINTNITTISASYLMLAEGALIAVVAINFLIGPIEILMLVLLVLIFGNTLILTIFQQHFDPKIIRNLITPILIIWLGMQYNHKVKLDHLIKFFAIIVVGVGFFEFLLPELYQRIFNVLNYQIAVGRSTEAALKYVDTSFSLNGTRWGGRNLLPFLGDHRSSSIFLETVNMSNFSVLLACWGLSKESLKSGWIFLLAAAVVAILADSRFASILISLLIILRFGLPLKMLEIIAYLSPVVVLGLCFYLQSPVGEDTFRGRLGSTGYYIANFKLDEFFGLSNLHYSKFVDQGYAYLIHFTGLILPIILWVSFCTLKMCDNQGRIFKSLIAFLISANLAVSGDSIFAFKWVSIMWFLVGTLLYQSKKKPVVAN